MSLRKRIGLVVLCVASFTAVGLFGQAQGRRNQPGLPPVDPPLIGAPTIISGADFGFRVDGRDGNMTVGTLMVRINGEWVEAAIGSRAGVRPVTAR